ncbi:MAG: subclass B1 metallo-beta-lactamase [Shewanella psychromarinicola]|uniref:subclass B1 metallo-beta-lactamase n=1 Tax=Shewanella psychromarinicola TaxID=2487742 RepID=UPI003002106D
MFSRILILLIGFVCCTPPVMSADSSGQLTITPITSIALVKANQAQSAQIQLFEYQSYFKTDDFGLVDANGLVVVEGKDAYLIDTPWSEKDTLALVDWIKQQGFVLKASISTHSHADRTAGINYLNSIGVSTHVSAMTQKILAKQDQALANQPFNGNSFTLANGLLEARYLGAGHTVDNIVVWIPKAQLLFGGCLVKSAHSKSMGYIAESSLTDWPITISKVKAAFPDAEVVVPGHGAIGNVELLDHTQGLVKDYLTKSAQ